MNTAHRGQGPGFPLLIATMLGAQTLGTMATMLIPAVAPKIAATYDVPSSLVGYQISLLAAAMLVSLTFGGNFCVRWGACRVTQIGLALLTAGCVIATLPHVGFLFAGAVALGLGYGLLSPSASHLLMRFTPPARRNLIFSLKQTGVPLGGIAAATIGPQLAVSIGWQWALLGDAALIAVLAALAQRGRRHWDDDREPAVPALSNPLEGLATVWRHPVLRLFSIAGGCFVMAQIGISTFTVILFNEEMRYTLVEAGIVLTAAQAGGVAGRIFWGWLADALRNCYTTLAWLAGAMLGAALLCAAITPSWPLLAASLLFFVFGSTASGWNGAFLAEVARLAPGGKVSSATGGSLVFVNTGKMLGPMAVAYFYALAGRYSAAFALLAVPALVGLGCVLAARGLPGHARLATARAGESPGSRAR